MDKKLTKFQIWTLFITYNSRSISFSREELLDECCKSAILDLQEGCIEEELNQLIDKEYLVGAGDHYRIALNGRLYVRKVHAIVSEKVENGKISPKIISKQDKSVADEIKGYNLTQNTFISTGIKNIGPIVELVRAATSWF